MKILTGIVTAKKMQKTATVTVNRFVSHPLYKKRMRITRKYQVHDETDHKIGEMVNFVACAPVSKTKKWKIVESAVAKKPAEAKVAKSEKAAKAKKETKAKPAAKKAKLNA